MRIKGLAILPAIVIYSLSTYAQDVTEAYNLSNLTVQGTARSMGFGNTLGSVGGDFSALSVNPAGIGIYRSSELTFTPALRINSATGDYSGTTSSDNNTRFNINNFGIVLTNAHKGKRYDHRSWKTVSFAFGMNRVADFNHDYSYSGVNNTSSATQVFESDANKYPGDAASAGPSSALGYMGNQSGLLVINSSGQYASVVPFTGGVNQLKSVHETGGINEYVISLGGNYKEKLMLGITIGIPSIYYNSNSIYTESLAAGNNAPNPDNFNSFTYGQALNITGTGINAKLGAIYKFSDYFRLGVAFHSPTYYSITDIFDPSLSSNSQGNSTYLTTNDALMENRFDYHLSTPWKGVVSATVMLNKFGFITADYEYVNYKSMKYRFPDGYDYGAGLSYQQEANDMNQVIRNTYKGASNFRLGAEGRFAKYFMARAGFGYYGDAYSETGKSATPASYTTERIDLSCGLGFRFKHFFTDLGLVHSMYKGYEQPYVADYSNVVSGLPATVPTAKINYSINNVALTVGVKI